MFKSASIYKSFFICKPKGGVLMEIVLLAGFLSVAVFLYLSDVQAGQ